jgi:hypothetical protein
MYTWWIFVKSGVGHFIKVTIQANTQQEAQIMLENQYGENLIGSAARQL